MLLDGKRGQVNDIRVSSQQEAPVRLTLFWTEAQRWEGRIYEVEIRHDRLVPRARSNYMRRKMRC
jgi:hypothetical protein